MAFVSDEPFLFYSDAPMTNNFVALWAGTAAHFEEQNVNGWVMKNAPGIPVKLANCCMTRNQGTSPVTAPKKALQPVQKPLRVLRSPELSRYVL